MKKRILLITNSFPFCNGGEDSFLIEEVKYISKNFNLHILPLNKKTPSSILPTDQGVHIYQPMNITHLQMLMHIPTTIVTCRKLIIREIVQNNRFFLHNLGMLKTMLAMIIRANIVKKNILNIFKEYSFDVLYSYWSSHSALALCLLPSNKYITISRAHRGDLYKESWEKNYFPFFETIFSNIQYVCPISNHGKNYLVKNIPSRKNNFKVSYLGINDQYVPGQKNKIADFHIVSCSFIKPVKRLDLIIRLLHTIKSKKTIFWTHIGSGEEKYINEIKNLIQQLGLSKKISISFTGHLQNKEIHDFYNTNHIDLFINMSDSEGIPVSIMEAQSHYIPVMARNVGGVSEIVDNNNGYLVEKEFNLAKNAQILNSIINEYKKEKRDLSRKTYEDKFNFIRNINNFLRMTGL